MPSALPRNAASSAVLEHRGCALGFCEAGEGPAILWIQGTGVHGDGWLPQIEDLAADFRCIWFDNRGMGRSTTVGNVEYSVEQLAEDALALLDHLGIERAHVVGHSLGGCIALQLALRAPTRALSLALLCTAADGPALVGVDAAMIWRGLRMQLGTRRSRRRAFLEIVLTPEQHAREDLDALAERLAPLFGGDLAERPDIVWKQVAAARRWNASARLGELARVRTLVVGAGLDLIARPPLYRALASGIPGAKLVELPDAAHGVPIIEPERINALLRELITG
jgi:3-oxoadipate enol-lactonase